MTEAALTAPRVRLVPIRPTKPPTALTEKRLTAVCEKIANGLPQTTAAIAAGIPRRTYQEWLRKGRLPNAKEPYRSMAERVESALAQYHESRVDLVAEGALRDPRLAQWELERRFKDDWGDPRRGDLNVNVGVTVETERNAAAELMLAAALRALDGDPIRLERFISELGGAAVVDGEIVAELPAELPA